MDINSIEFNNFVNEFYSNKSNKKMVLTLDIENGDNPNIYDIHVMLLELLIYGFTKFNLNINNNLDNSINYLQNYFTNIDIKINISNYSKKELILENSPYISRYIRFTSESETMTINGSHQTVNNLNLIKSFYLVDDNYNLCINFDFIV